MYMPGIYIRLAAMLTVTTPTILQAQSPNFGTGIETGVLQPAVLTEVSGIAASRSQPGVLWVHNDSGGAAAVYAVNTAGDLLGTYTLSGTVNRDWEDIAIGPGPDPDRDYLYVGEIGDNNAVYTSCAVYRVPEPDVPTSGAPASVTLTGVVTLAYRYADGPRDAETLMLDPVTRDLYVVTKRETNVGVYGFSYPQSASSTTVISAVATLPVTRIVGGDIAPSGDRIIMKTYLQSFWWLRELTQSVASALSAAGITIPHAISFTYPQNEAIGWAAANQGYFTLAEGAGAPIVFFTNLNGSVVGDRDEDGMKDTWEWAYFGELGVADEETDGDSDGIPDLGEYIAGTGPIDPLSFLRVEGGQPDNGSFIIHWSAAADRTYRVYASPTPDGSYTLVTSTTATAATDLSVTIHPGAGAVFRIEASRP